MISRFQIGLMAGLTVIALGTGVAFAAMSVDDTIKARKACMKAHGAVVGMAVGIMKGEKQFDAAALKGLYDAEDAACKDWANFWGPDTMKGQAEQTHALPAVWDDPKAFEAASGAWYAADQKLRAATDKDSLVAAIPAVGSACKGCHDKFRAPLQ
jgi:cytochrome c556